MFDFLLPEEVIRKRALKRFCRRWESHKDALIVKNVEQYRRAQETFTAKMRRLKHKTGFHEENESKLHERAGLASHPVGVEDVTHL